MNFFKFYWKTLAGNRRRSVFFIILFGISGFLEGVVLLTLIPILNSGAPNSGQNEKIQNAINFLNINPDYLPHYAISSFVIFGILSAAVAMWTEGGLLHLRTTFVKNLRKKISLALLKIQWSEFHSMRIGEINKAVLVEPNFAAQGMTSFITALGATFTAVVFSATAFFISVEMTLITLCFVAIIGVGYKIAGNKATAHSEKWSEASSGMGESVSEVFGNLKYFRSTGHSESAKQRSVKIFEDYSHSFFWSQVLNVFMRFAYHGGGFLFLGGILAVSLLILKTPMVEMVVLMAVFYRMTPRIRTAQDLFYNARTYRVWYEKWEERYNFVLSHQEAYSGNQVPEFNRALEVCDLKFNYPNANGPVLNGLSFNLKKNQCIAFVGESGSGKSTCIDLITGLLRPDSGKITLDGIPIQNIDIEKWRSKIGLVMQESPTFHTTILENITWGTPHPDREWTKHCAKLAHAWDFINTHPEGLDTIVGEKGGRLSVGQKQRIALARALYRNPWLLILDEATSALDGESEKIIQDSLNELKGKFAIFLVAHRLKTVQMADEIYVLSEGRVVENGSWDELINRQDGTFRKMAELQGLVKPYEKTERI